MNKHLKFIFRLLLALLVLNPSLGHAQLFRGQKLKKVERRNDALLAKDSLAIVLPPMEQVPESRPVSLKRMTEAQEVTNWGRQVLLPASVQARLLAECKYPVRLKITDTARKLGHTYLARGQIPGTDYTGEGGDDDGNGHSTHCTGIAAGQEVGLASALVEKGLLTFEPIKILTNAGSGSFSMVEQCYKSELAKDKALLSAGTSVVYSGSFGGGTSDLASVDAALKASTDAGVIFVFAAGNSGTSGVGYPGRSQYGIAVASLDQSPMVRSSFSSTGQQVWVAMPGRSINSTYKGNTFAVLSGTSMATPFAAALVCIAKSKYGPNSLRTVAATRAYLAWVCSDLPPTGKDDATGYGVAYVLSVLDKDPANTPGGPVNPPPPPPPPPVDTTPVRPVFPQRVLSIPVEGPFQIVWNEVTGNGRDAKGRFASQKAQTYGPNELQSAGIPAGFKPFTVLRLTLGVTTTTDLPNTHALTLNNVRQTLTGRGYGLVKPADGAEALKWCAYFVELLIDTQATERQTVRVLDIEGVGLNGERVRWSDAQLPHWKK